MAVLERDMSEHLGMTSWRTRLIQSEAGFPMGFRSLAAPVHRGSTVVFERLADAHDEGAVEAGLTYGLYGTPTTRELAARVAELEGARRTFVVPGGQAATALVFLSLCRAGSHVLLPDSAYEPTARFAGAVLARMGVEVETYPALIAGGVEALLRPDTAVLWCESPGSITMEVQDVPALVAAARRRGVPVALDNTYAAGVLFDAFAHGVDVSMQALTKYVGGHSDLLLGTVSVRSEVHERALRATQRQLGLGVSPDDCSLALRGLQTLGLRLDHLERSTLAVARWLADRPEVEAVLHPALPSCPGHDAWRRDFTGSASVFSIVLRPGLGRAFLVRFVEGLRLFRIGFSWGGVTSLVMAYGSVPRGGGDVGERLVRLNVGLEDVDDLLADLAGAFGKAGA